MESESSSKLVLANSDVVLLIAKEIFDARRSNHATLKDENPRA